MNAKLTTDFSRAYTIMLSELGMQDALKDNSMIDHLAYKDLTLNGYGLDTSELTLYASDHKPIYIDVTLK